MTAPVYDQLMAYPPYETPFLQTWNGVFEAVFVAFHPFARVKGRDPFVEGRTVVPKTGEPLRSAPMGGAVGEVVREIEADATLLYAGSALTPEEVGDSANLEILTWAKIAEQTRLQGGPAQLNHALLSLIGALKHPDTAARDTLVALARREGLFLPSEGAMQPLLLPALRRWFEGLGHAEVVVQPEFDDGRIVPVEKLEEWADRVSLYDPGKTVLVVVDWDSFFTLVAGPRRALEDWVRAENLDGFFADKKTGHDWWNPPIAASQNIRS